MYDYATQKDKVVRAWLVERPWLAVHFIPTHASWMNLAGSGLASIETHSTSHKLKVRPVKDHNVEISAFTDGSHPIRVDHCR